MGSAKILVVGSVQGQLKKAFEKIAKLHTKQDFALALIVGDVFSEAQEAEEELDALLNGSIAVPLPTYFNIGDSSLPEKVIQRLEASEDVCPNLLFLGRKGTFTTSDGIKIVSLGGRLVENKTTANPTLGKFDPMFLDADARGLHGAHSAHILLTNQWPANVHRLSSFEVPESVDKSLGAQSIANLCLALKPWYHFSSSPTAAWEREPFKQPDEYGSVAEAKVTRFKSAASVGAPNKEWMTAFSINTSTPPVAQQSTEAPFLHSSAPRKRAAGDEHAPYSRYGKGDHDGHSRRPGKRPRNKDPSDCFMCLNKPGFKTHMVVSIGDESLVTVLRGPLPLPSTFPQLSFSGHVMIIPHYHAADELALGKRPAIEVAAEFSEMTRFRKALSNMIGSKSEGKLGTVCWEVNRTGIRHFHWQLIAAQAEQLRKGLVEAAFKISQQNNKLPPFEPCEPEEQLEQRSDYFRIWTWMPSENPIERADRDANGEADEGTTKSMFFSLPATEQSFNIWFGREVMAGIMQLENRVNWKAELHPDEDEETKIEVQDAAGLKEDFAEFDFAMQ